MMTHKAKTTPIVSTRIPADQLALIDKLSKRFGVTRSTMIRMALKTGTQTMDEMSGLSMLKR